MSAADYIGSSVKVTTKTGEVIEGCVTKINSQSIALNNVKNKPKVRSMIALSSKQLLDDVYVLCMQYMPVLTL